MCSPVRAHVQLTNSVTLEEQLPNSYATVDEQLINSLHKVLLLGLEMAYV